MNNGILLRKAIQYLHIYCPYHSARVLLNVHTNYYCLLDNKKIGYIDFTFYYEPNVKCRIIIDCVELRVAIFYDSEHIVVDY